MAHAVLTRQGEAFGEGVPEPGELERAQRPGEVGADGIDRLLHVSRGDDVRVGPGDDGVWPDRIWFWVVGGVRLTMSG